MYTYGLSLLTNRHFIIDMKMPCNFSKLFTPNKVNWLPSSEHSDYLKGTHISMDCTKRYEECAYDNIKKIKEDVIYMRATDHGADIFYKTKNKSFDLERDVMSLGVVKRFREFTLENLFHTWYKEASLDTKYNLIKQQAFANKSKIYCAQIRIGGKRPDVAFDANFNHRNVTKLFWQFIRNNFIPKDDLENWKLFITSDLEEVETEAINEFGIDKVIRIDGINTHMGREKQLSNDCTRIEKPILDFHFVQNCDKAVISKSGFGQLAAWNRVEPKKDLHVLGTSFFDIDPDWKIRVLSDREKWENE